MVSINYQSINQKTFFSLIGAIISYWTSFLMFISYDPSFRMTKLSHMIKHFYIDVEKRLFSFHCRTKSYCKAFTVLISKYDISKVYKNAIKMVFSVPFLLR